MPRPRHAYRSSREDLNLSTPHCQTKRKKEKHKIEEKSIEKIPPKTTVGNSFLPFPQQIIDKVT
jgi:hypothetical protein